MLLGYVESSWENCVANLSEGEVAWLYLYRSCIDVSTARVWVDLDHGVDNIGTVVGEFLMAYMSDLAFLILSNKVPMVVELRHKKVKKCTLWNCSGCFGQGQA